MIDFLFSLLTTKWVRFKYRLLRKKVFLGRNVRISGGFIVKGDGKLQIGDNCRIYGKGHPVTPFTHGRDAEIHIGNNCFLNGTRFGCENLIKIGNECILADARIMDTDFHPINPDDRLDGKKGKIGEVILGDNVWIGAGSFILRDTHIGNGSVVAAGSVVKGYFGSNILIAGNPARVVKNLK